MYFSKIFVHDHLHGIKNFLCIPDILMGVSVRSFNPEKRVFNQSYSGQSFVPSYDPLSVKHYLRKLQIISLYVTLFSAEFNYK